MKNTLRVVAVAAAAAISAPVFAAAALDANAEFDTTYYRKNQDKFQQGGRIEVNISGKTTVGDGYVAGRGTAILGESGTPAGVDDAWVEGGIGAFNVRLGRFEATPLATYPADVLVVGRVGYMGDKLRGRNIGNNDSYVVGDARDVSLPGQPHFTFNGDLGGGMKIEVGLLEQNTGGNVNCNAANVCSKSVKFGLRPVFKFASGPISGAVGFEKSGLPGSKVGVAGTGAFDLGGGTSVGVNLASEGKNGDIGQTSSATGYGVFATFGPVNVAAQAGKDHFGNKGNYFYATYSMPFFVPAATFTLALSTGKTPSGAPTTGNSKIDNPTDTGLRARVHYDF